MVMKFESISGSGSEAGEDAMSKRTLVKISIGILNVVLACWFIMYLIGVACFSWFANGGPSTVPEKRPAWVLDMLPLFCFCLVMISCAITDLIMAIKLRRNPSDEKAKNIRKKGKNILLISFVVLLYLGVAMFIFTQK